MRRPSLGQPVEHVFFDHSPVFQFRRTRNLGMAPKSAGNLRAKASSEDLEGVKYIHSQRVMGRTGDTRRCPRPRELPRSGLAGANVVISCFI